MCSNNVDHQYIENWKYSIQSDTQTGNGTEHTYALCISLSVLDLWTWF